jgi:hypothetical protein
MDTLEGANSGFRRESVDRKLVLLLIRDGLNGRNHCDRSSDKCDPAGVTQVGVVFRIKNLRPKSSNHKSWPRLLCVGPLMVRFNGPDQADPVS